MTTATKPRQRKATPKPAPTTLYKFLRLWDERVVSNYDNACVWQIGEWKATTKAPERCDTGFHGSRRILDALGYVKGEILAEVEVAGEVYKGDDKEAWQRMRILRAWRWTKEDSVKLAIFAAEQVIDLYEKLYPNDTRPRDAIVAAKAYLERPTDAAAHAAHAATDAAAAAAAAHAAHAAAHAAHAAHAAVYAAVYAVYAADAAVYAAHAAVYAAKQKALDDIETWLVAHLNEMTPYIATQEVSA